MQKYRTMDVTKQEERQSVKLVAKMYEVLMNYTDFPALNLPKISFDCDGSDDEFDDKGIEDTHSKLNPL